MRALFLSFLTVGIAVSCLIALFAALTPLLRRHYKARLRRLVWLVLAVRLLIPWSLPLPAAASPVVKVTVPAAAAQRVEEYAVPTAGGPGPIPVSEFNEAMQPRPTGRSLPAPLDMAAALWLAGVLLFALVPLARYGLWRHGLRRWDRPLSPAAQACYRAACARVGLAKPPRAWENDMVETPLLAGLFRPVLLVPARLAADEALEAMLLHELVHAKRHDVAYKLVFLAARAVHWYNPLAWLLLRLAGRDVEFACDEAVLALPQAPDAKTYGGALLTAVPPKHPAALAAQFSGGKEALKRRFAAIFDRRPKRAGRPVLAAAALLAALGASLAACEVAAQPVKEAVSGAAQSAAPTPQDTALPASVTSTVGVPRGYRLFPSGAVSGLGENGAVLNEQLAAPDLTGLKVSVNGMGCWLPDLEVALAGGVAEDGALVLLRSADHGVTWQRRETPGDFGTPFALDVVGADRCVLLTYEDDQHAARVYQCALDAEGFPVVRGARNYALPIPQNATVGRGLFLNQNIGFVSYVPAGRLATKPYVLVTTDGGVHWRKEDFAEGLAGSPYQKYRACCVFYNGKQVEVRCFTEEGASRENLSLVSEDFGQTWSWRRRVIDLAGARWEVPDPLEEDVRESSATALVGYLEAYGETYRALACMDKALLPWAESGLTEAQHRAWENALNKGAQLGWVQLDESYQKFFLLEQQGYTWTVTSMSQRMELDSQLRDWYLKDAEESRREVKWAEAQIELDTYLRDNGAPRTPQEAARLKELQDRYDEASREWATWTAQRPTPQPSAPQKGTGN